MFELGSEITSETPDHFEEIAFMLCPAASALIAFSNIATALKKVKF